jgi:hypothetical protein
MWVKYDSPLCKVLINFIRLTLNSYCRPIMALFTDTWLLPLRVCHLLLDHSDLSISLAYLLPACIIDLR